MDINFIESNNLSVCRREATEEMVVGLPKSATRSWLQTTSGGYY